MTQTLTKEIKKYIVNYFGGGKRATSPYPYRAIISLRDDAGRIIAALYFYDDPGSMPDSDYLPDTGQPMSYYSIDDFPRILDILRNEGPVYYHQLSNWPTMAWIRTSLEPVGDGEPT